MSMECSHGNSETGLSLQRVCEIRAEGFALLRHLHATSQLVAQHIEAVDTALQSTLAERSIDDHLALVSASRRLAALLELEVAG